MINTHDLLKRIEDLEEKLDAMTVKPVKPAEPEALKLNLIVNGDDLAICYGYHIIGHIEPEGHCLFMNTPERRDLYKQWLESGQLVDETPGDTPVEWRGKNYYLNYNGGLWADIDHGGCIFRFAFGTACHNCKDDNIARYPTNTPIMFA